MGKIFGISDLPVSTIMTPFEPIIDFKPQYKKTKTVLVDQKPDVFIPTTKLPKKNSKSFVNMRNGFGKLMKHFSKKLIK